MLHERKGLCQDPLSKEEEEAEDLDAYDSHETDSLLDTLGMDDEDEDVITNHINNLKCCSCFKMGSNKIGATNEPDAQENEDHGN
jgi:hypothetical protein